MIWRYLKIWSPLNHPMISHGLRPYKIFPIHMAINSVQGLTSLDLSIHNDELGDEARAFWLVRSNIPG